MHYLSRVINTWGQNETTQLWKDILTEYSKTRGMGRKNNTI